MTKLLKMLLTLSLIAILLVSCPKKLRADTPITLPPNYFPSTGADRRLVPSDNPFFCTDEIGAKKLRINHDQNVDCHSQLKSTSSSTDWSTVIVAGITALILGYAIGATK